MFRPVHRPIYRAIASSLLTRPGGFNPASLFADGSIGVLYDNNDLTTMFLDAAGTTPATVNGLVGLQLDNSQGLVLGAELASAPFTDSAVWLDVAANVTSRTATSFTTSASGGVQLGASSGGGNILQTNKRYEVIIVWTKTNAASTFSVRMQSGIDAVSATGTSGTFRLKEIVVGGTMYLRNSAADTVTISSISVKELPGNHRYQTTTGSKPILRGTPTGGNLVTNGDFASGTGWTLTSGATISGGTLNLDGNGAPGNVLGYQNIGLTTGKTYLVRCSIASVTGSVQVWDNGGTPLASFTTTGAKEFYFTHNNASGNIVFRAAIGANTASIDNVQVFDVSAGSVNAPYGLQYDGVDDFMQTASVNFSATDKMFVCAGVRKLSDAARGMVVEASTTSANPGAWSIEAPSSVSPSLSFFNTGSISRGATVNSAPYAAPITLVVGGVGDISGDKTDLRVNGSVVANSPSDLGTGNYGNYPLYFGRRAGTSLPFNGLDYGFVIVGKTLTAAQISSTERWMAQRTGVSI